MLDSREAILSEIEYIHSELGRLLNEGLNFTHLPTFTVFVDLKYRIDCLVPEILNWAYLIKRVPDSVQPLVLDLGLNPEKLEEFPNKIKTRLRRASKSKIHYELKRDDIGTREEIIQACDIFHSSDHWNFRKYLEDS